MREKTIKLYQFDELSDKAKETAIKKLYGINIDYGWWEFVYEDVKEIGKLMGIDISNIYFSGFSSQGDGACFVGNYEYRKNSVKDVIAFAPKNTELHNIVRGLFDLQKTCFYQIRANIKHSGHYSHEYCTNINVSFENWYSQQDFYDQDKENSLTELLRDFMRWIYRGLEKEYEYLTSEEAIIENIHCNEYEFTENGELT